MSYKRLKLLKFTAGTACKQGLFSILSGDSTLSITGEVLTDKFILGMEGNLLLTSSLSSDSTAYKEDIFDRDYSVNNPDLEPSKYNLNVKPPLGSIIDMAQFGDYTFNLTELVFSGAGFATKCQPTTSDFYREEHTLVTYKPGSETSEIEYVINKIGFDLTTASQVYGLISGDNLLLYSPNALLSSNTVYSDSDVTSTLIPFNYLMEQPMNYNVKFPLEDVVYGEISGDTIYTYILNSNLLSPSADIDDDALKVYYNAFKLKNLYNYNWQTEVTRPDIIYGIRDYKHVGRSQDKMWLSYKYYREVPSIIQEFELAERVQGLYKLVPFEGHKSNIYSIRVVNSGLNEDITDTNIRSSIRSIVEREIIKAVKKMTPSSTAFWYLDFVGR